MTSALAKFNSGRRTHQGISLPDMAPFASLFFLFVYFALITTRFKSSEVGLVSDDELPYSITHACVPEVTESVVSLNSKHQLSFAVTHPKIQTASIQKVASQHGIIFTPAQFAELKKISFLNTDVQNLPDYLSLSVYRRSKIVELKKLRPLSEQQLMECLAAAKLSAATLTPRPISVALRIESEVEAPYVERLLDLLQDQGTNRVILDTRSK